MLNSQWEEKDVNPLEDIKKALASIKEPIPESYYYQKNKLEKDVQKAIELLIKENKTPEEIERILIEYRIWWEI